MPTVILFLKQANPENPGALCCSSQNACSFPMRGVILLLELCYLDMELQNLRSIFPCLISLITSFLKGLSHASQSTVRHHFRSKEGLPSAPACCPGDLAWSCSSWPNPRVCKAQTLILSLQNQSQFSTATYLLSILETGRKQSL